MKREITLSHESENIVDGETCHHSVTVVLRGDYGTEHGLGMALFLIETKRAELRARKAKKCL